MSIELDNKEYAGDSKPQVEMKISQSLTKRDPKIAFDIGWDFAFEGLRLPRNAVGIKDMQDGFSAAKVKRAKPENDADRYTTKCLMLRFNAWVRGRTFNTSVDADFLRLIDVEYCPVTDELLTHGTGQPTDWSVDRIANNGAYACANLIVMSTRANIAKGSYTYRDIIKFAYYLDEEIPTHIEGGFKPLTREEWARMSTVCSYGPSRQNGDDGQLMLPEIITPCRIQPPSGLLISVANEFQLGIAFKAVASVMHGHSGPGHMRICQRADAAIKGLSPGNRDAYNKLLSRAKKSSFDPNEPLTMWRSHTLFKHFSEFYYNKVSSEEYAKVVSIIGAKAVSSISLDMDQKFNFETNGYEPDRVKPISREYFLELEADEEDELSDNPELDVELINEVLPDIDDEPVKTKRRGMSL